MHHESNLMIALLDILLIDADCINPQVPRNDIVLAKGVQILVEVARSQEYRAVDKDAYQICCIAPDIRQRIKV